MATDWQPYAEQMLETLDQAEGFENTAGIGNYALRPAYRPMTKFERRGERLGHGSMGSYLSKNRLTKCNKSRKINAYMAKKGNTMTLFRLLFTGCVTDSRWL